MVLLLSLTGQCVASTVSEVGGPFVTWDNLFADASGHPRYVRSASYKESVNLCCYKEGNCFFACSGYGDGCEYWCFSLGSEEYDLYFDDGGEYAFVYAETIPGIDDFESAQVFSFSDERKRESERGTLYPVVKDVTLPSEDDEDNDDEESDYDNDL